MTDEEMQIWRDRSENLRRIVMGMEAGPDRAAIAFAAGAIQGLARRVYDHPGAPHSLEAVARLVAAARAMFNSELEVARRSYTVDDNLDDDQWLDEDPEGAAIALELHRPWPHSLARENQNQTRTRTSHVSRASPRARHLGQLDRRGRRPDFLPRHGGDRPRRVDA